MYSRWQLFFWEKSWHWDGENGLDFVWVICYLFVKPYPPKCCFTDTHVIQPQDIQCCVRLFSAQNMRKKHQLLMEKWKRFLEAIFVAHEFSVVLGTQFFAGFHFKHAFASWYIHVFCSWLLFIKVMLEINNASRTGWSTTLSLKRGGTVLGYPRYLVEG